jgi:hypothetical protein
VSNQDIDVNLIIQSFQEKISQLTTELVVKEATIKQLSFQIEEILSQKQKDIKEK